MRLSTSTWYLRVRSTLMVMRAEVLLRHCLGRGSTRLPSDELSQGFLFFFCRLGLLGGLSELLAGRVALLSPLLYADASVIQGIFQCGKGNDIP